MRIQGTFGHAGKPYDVAPGPRLVDVPRSVFENLPPQPEWMADALCAQADPELWHPEKGGSTRDAKRVCAACPVKAQCLGYAMARNERWGIWGGLSERERRRLKRALNDRRVA